MGTDTARPTCVRYLIVGLATLAAFLLYLDRYCLSFALDFVKKDLRLTEGQGQVLLGAFFLSYALGQVPAGWFSDRYGARVMFTLYILLWSLFTGLFGLAHSFALVLLYRLGCGLAQAGAYPTSASLLSKWVPFARRGMASGIVSVGGRVGGAAAPVLTAYLILRFVPPGGGEMARAGWRSVMVLFGLTGIGMAALFWWLYRDWPRLHPSCNAAEVALIAAGGGLASGADAARVGGPPWRSLLCHRGSLLSSVSQFGTNFGWAFLSLSLPGYLAKVHEVSDVLRGWMSGLPILVGIPGMFCGGWLTDYCTRRMGLRWGRALPWALTRFCAMAAFLACLGHPSAWQVTVAMVVVALATDLGTAAVWAFAQDIGGRHSGSVLGWGNMWGNFGAAASPVATGFLVGRFGWDLGFAACAAAFFLSGLTALGIDARVPLDAADPSRQESAATRSP